MPLASKDASALDLLDALQVHHMPVSQKVMHAPDPISFHYDDRKISKGYFRCVLIKDELFIRGVTRFSSGMTVVYYQVLLQAPEKFRPDLSTKELQAILSKAPEMDASRTEKINQKAAPPRVLDRDAVRRVRREPFAPPVHVHSNSPSRSSSSSSSSSSKVSDKESTSDPDDKSDLGIAGDSDLDDAPSDGFPETLWVMKLQRQEDPVPAGVFVGV